MNNKKIYAEPRIDLIKLDAKDILADSPNDPFFSEDDGLSKEKSVNAF